MRDYYERVGAYFDEDAEAFDRRYWENPVLQRIRQAFREEVKRRPFERALEIGCGTGLDLAHFATIYPERTFEGVDVSAEMIVRASARLRRAGLDNARATVAGSHRVREAFGEEAFDLCYVFFGALNTVEDLRLAADDLFAVTRPGGHLVLSFVNRWYLAEIAVGLARGRWKRAFARLRPQWGGYSPARVLESHCLSPSEVMDAFGRSGTLVSRRGFSITYPAWYRSPWVTRLGRAAEGLWDLDRWLQSTPAWALGEYTLFVFRKPSSQ